jgi:CheY-like chemotaxis protein
VARPATPSLFLTGNGEAYRRTLGGTKKLSGSELYVALANPLQSKLKKPGAPSLLQRLPQVYARAQYVRPLVDGRRVLWVDDNPSNNFYERVALSEMGIAVDVATSSEEAMNVLTYLRADVIVSDMKRHGRHDAGLALLRAIRSRGMTTPVIFYVGEVVEELRRPPGSFGITDRPDEVLHLILDLIERGAS